MAHFVTITPVTLWLRRLSVSTSKSPCNDDGFGSRGTHTVAPDYQVNNNVANWRLARQLQLVLEYYYNTEGMARIIICSLDRLWNLIGSLLSILVACQIWRLWRDGGNIVLMSFILPFFRYYCNLSY